jgi:hypothetical protein
LITGWFEAEELREFFDLAVLKVKTKGSGLIGRQAFKTAGEGGRTLDIHVGNVTLYH